MKQIIYIHTILIALSINEAGQSLDQILEKHKKAVGMENDKFDKEL